MSRKTIRAILIDFGGVLFEVDIPGYIKKLSSHVTRDPDEVKKILTSKDGLRLRFALECGKIKNAQFPELLGRQLNAFIHPTFYSQFIHLHIKGLNQHTYSLIQRISSKHPHLPIIGITNIDKKHLEFAEKILQRDWIIKIIIASCHVGVRKPNRVIYHLARRAAGCRMSECLFIDDRKENIETAQKLGMQTHHFKDAEKLKKAFKEKGLL